MKVAGALFAALSIPLLFLNLLGGIVGGIWLALLGEWPIIISGFAILLLGPWVASILLAPGFGLAGLGVMSLERGKGTLGWCFILLAAPWAPLVIIVWEVAIFLYFGNRAAADNSLPIWLWTYGSATGVWTYMANKERQISSDDGSTAMAFGAQIAFIILSVCYIGLGWSLISSIIVMAVPIVLPMALALVVARVATRGFRTGLE